MSPTKEFERQLELFRADAERALQFFYAAQAVHAIASNDKAVLRLLNKTPMLWNTVLGALQAAGIMSLGRVFDQSSESHSLTRLLDFAHKNLEIFSREALAVRKRSGSSNADEWLPQHLKSAYVPVSADFRRLKDHVKRRRKVYTSIYHPIRNKVFAHSGVSTEGEVDALFSKTDIGEMEKLLVFLGRLYDVLWQLYHNGRKPTLKPARSSVKRIIEQPSPATVRKSLQERLVQETKEFLTIHAKNV